MFGMHTVSFDSDRVRLTLVYEEVIAGLRALFGSSIQAWFFDGFSPDRNPEMWTPEVFETARTKSAEGATFATYSAATAVRKAIEASGFRVEKFPGFGKKREMLRGRL